MNTRWKENAAVTAGTKRSAFLISVLLRASVFPVSDYSHCGMAADGLFGKIIIITRVSFEIIVSSVRARNLSLYLRIIIPSSRVER